MESPRWTISPDQWTVIKKSLIKYTVPLLLVFCLQLQQNVPLKDALYTVYGAALQLVINVLSKLVTEN